MTRRMNLEGNVFGELTVVSFSHTTESNRMSNYLCRCSCGIEKVVSHGNLRSGHTTHCGCKRPRGKDVYNFIHGFSKNHKTYKSWCKIKERCFNPNDCSYKNYGAIGVLLSEEYKDDFLAFYKEVGEPPGEGRNWSVDRIDNNLGYEKGNMRWASTFQQARNKGKMKNNSSGFTGVHWEDKVHPSGKNSTTYAVVQWKEYGSDGVKIPRKKSFSTKKYGLLPAFAMAVKYRKEVIAELNRKGYGYANNHGD